MKADYDQSVIFPPRLEDWINKDHPARFIRALFGEMDLESLGIAAQDEVEPGRPHYSPALLLMIWMYGYLRKIRSTRELELACRENVGFMWLAGRHVPDHTTLHRFFRKHSDLFPKLFRQVVGVGVHAGLVGMAVHAVDGTKIQSESSRHSAWFKKNLEKTLAQAEKAATQLTEEIEQADDKDVEPSRLHKDLEDAEALRTLVSEQLAELKALDREQMHPGEPDAEMMKCGRNIEFAHNAQAVSDRDSGMVVAIEITSSASDSAQLTPMLDEVHETLGSVAEETLADGGYPNAEQLGKAESKGYSVIAAVEHKKSRSKPFHSSKFRHDDKTDCAYCPLGQVLPFERVKKDKKERELRVYRCRQMDCPKRSTCTKDPRGRSFEWGEHMRPLDRQRARHEDPDTKTLLRQRSMIIESLFGWIKHNDGFRRWTVRGRPAVKAQFALLTTAINLRKLYRHWKEGALPQIP
jgi:transposase